MSKRPWFPFYTADFERKTRHLSAECVGCYVRLLDHYWDNNGHLDYDPVSLCRIMGVDRRRFNHIWRYLDTFWVIVKRKEGNTLLQERLQAELEKTIEISKAKAEAGRKGGLAKAKAESQQTPTHSHSHTHKEHSVNKLTGDDSPEIDEKEEAKKRLWETAKKTLKISGGVIGKAIKQYGEHPVACAIEATVDKSPADPTPFFLALLKKNPTTGRLPDWALVPYDDKKLQDWAVKHGYGAARLGEGYPEYRARLVSAVTLRKDKAA